MTKGGDGHKRRSALSCNRGMPEEPTRYRSNVSFKLLRSCPACSLQR
jgi:hypothetical protein